MGIYCLLILFIISVSNAKYFLVETENDQEKSENRETKMPTEEGQDYAHEDYENTESKCTSKVSPINNPIEGATTKGKNCRIHHECGFGEVCSKNWKCEVIYCANTKNCQEKVTLPSVCLNGMCSSSTYCKSNAECRNAGEEYICENDSGQCKPQFGKCHITCDCLHNYGMIKGEALCKHTGTHEEREKVCLCRSNHIWWCGGNKTVTIKTTPTPVVIETGNPIEGGYATPEQSTTTTTTTTTTTPPPPSECPPVLSIDPGREGKACFTNEGCREVLKLICLKKEGEGKGKSIGVGSVTPGTCKKVECKKDDDCKKTTLLPSYCRKGLCHRGFCYEDNECPKGYGCADGECKVKFGSCEYDCDCGPCHHKKCINKTCYCNSVNDDCEGITQLETTIPEAGKATCKKNTK